MALEGALNLFDFIAHLLKGFAVGFQASEMEIEHSKGVLSFLGFAFRFGRQSYFVEAKTDFLSLTNIFGAYKRNKGIGREHGWFGSTGLGNPPEAEHFKLFLAAKGQPKEW